MLGPGDALPQGSQSKNSMSKDGQRDLSEKRECDRPTEAAPTGGDLSRALRCGILTLDPGLAGRAHPGPGLVRDEVVPSSEGGSSHDRSLFCPQRRYG